MKVEFLVRLVDAGVIGAPKGQSRCVGDVVSMKVCPPPGTPWPFVR